MDRLPPILGYIHQTMNHSKNLRDPETNICTNHVETYWNAVINYQRLEVQKTQWWQTFGLFSPHTICMGLDRVVNVWGICVWMSEWVNDKWLWIWTYEAKPAPPGKIFGELLATYMYRYNDLPKLKKDGILKTALVVLWDEMKTIDHWQRNLK